MNRVYSNITVYPFTPLRKRVNRYMTFNVLFFPKFPRPRNIDRFHYFFLLNFAQNPFYNICFQR